MTDVCCIYCIKHKLDDEWNDIYIGSTEKFEVRIKQHDYDCNTETSKRSKYKVYDYIRVNGGMDNFEFIILEECEKDKLKRLEQSYMDVYKPTLNCINACGFDSKKYNKKYYKKNKEYLLKESKKRYVINKEKNSEYCKEYYEKHKKKLNKNYECECGGKFTYKHKASHLKTKKHQAFISSQSS